MSSDKWRLLENKENFKFYHKCKEHHLECSRVVGILRNIVLKLKGREHLDSTSLKQEIELQELNIAAEILQTVVPRFKKLLSQKLPTDHSSKSHGRPKSKDTSSGLDYKINNVSAPPKRNFSYIVPSAKASYWRNVLKEDQTVLLFLSYKVVVDVLKHCNNIAEQNHNHETLENLFRISNMYNEMLALSAKDNQPVSTWCKNTCPILLHPLRKLTITKILQILAQYRAEHCCRSLVDRLLSYYFELQPSDNTLHVTNSGLETGDHSENSSFEIYRALTHNISPVHTPVMPPVEKIIPGTIKSSTIPYSTMPDIEKLVILEERHIITLLSVTARTVPHLLGHSGVKPSKNSGAPKVSKHAREKVLDYYRQILWGEVGSFMEHVVLWWGSNPLGTASPEHCRNLRDWLHCAIIAGRMPCVVTPAVQSLIDALGCHVVSTLWDHMFRLTLVRGGQKQTKKEQKDIADLDHGTFTGHLFAALFENLVTLCNNCESTTEWLSAPPIEDLPLVEQIPVLHRMDHSVHTARLWAENLGRQLANAWQVDTFFLVTQCDVDNCLRHLEQLQLTDHKDLTGVKSEHVIVCVKMRTKLVSEVRENIIKLKKLPEQCIGTLAAVCKTFSLANLQMCFPDSKGWQKNGNGTQVANTYVDEYLERVLKPVLLSISPLQISVQQTVTGMVLRIMCEAWLDHIYTHRVKFTEWGAVQLLTDFGAIPLWLSKQVMLPTEVMQSLLKHEVLRKCEGVGKLLLRRRGEPIAMVSQPARSQARSESRSESPEPDCALTMPAEMYVPNQEQWLELRASNRRGLCNSSMCCSS